MRLYDRVMAYPKTRALVESGEAGARAAGGVPEDFDRALLPGIHGLGEAVVIDATDATRYFYDTWDWHEPVSLDQLTPTIAPPFHLTWWESRVPSNMREHTGVQIDGFGALAQAFDLWDTIQGNDDFRDAESMIAAATLLDPVLASIAQVQDHVPHDIVTPIRWVVIWFCYVELDGGRAAGPMFTLTQAIQPDGTIGRHADGRETWIITATAKGLDPKGVGGQWLYRACLAPLILAVGFTHCRNIDLVDGPAVPPKIAARWRKDHGADPVQFKVLTIDPMRSVLSREGNIEHNGLKRALHICRGHFAHYTEDRPLFGKFTGTFWRPHHVRGRADEGVVRKNYAVKAPGGSA